MNIGNLGNSRCEKVQKLLDKLTYCNQCYEVHHVRCTCLKPLHCPECNCEVQDGICDGCYNILKSEKNFYQGYHRKGCTYRQEE